MSNVIIFPGAESGVEAVEDVVACLETCLGDVRRGQAMMVSLVWMTEAEGPKSIFRSLPGWEDYTEFNLKDLLVENERTSWKIHKALDAIDMLNEDDPDED